MIDRSALHPHWEGWPPERVELLLEAWQAHRSCADCLYHIHSAHLDEPYGICMHPTMVGPNGRQMVTPEDYTCPKFEPVEESDA